MKHYLIPYITISPGGDPYDFGIDVYNDSIDSRDAEFAVQSSPTVKTHWINSIGGKAHIKFLLSSKVSDGDYQVFITVPSDCYISAFLLDKRGSTTYVPLYEVAPSLGN